MIPKIPGWARLREQGFLTGEMVCCLMFLVSVPVQGLLREQSQ